MSVSAPDNVFSRFASALRRGEAPSLERTVASLPPAQRAALFPDLLVSELVFRMTGEAPKIDLPTVSEYQQRYPSFRERIEPAFRKALAGLRVLLEHPEAPEARPRYDAVFADLLLRREIGRGGMGVVYLAEQVSRKRLVAVKFLRHPTNPKCWHLFRGEVRAMAKLGEEAFVRLFALGKGPHAPFLVMEYIKGMSLADWMETRRPFELREVLRIGARVARAVERLHAAGVLHRDLKPENILLACNDHGIWTLKVGDFGLAEAVSEGEAAPGSAEGGVYGSVRAMAPEQTGSRAKGGATFRTDVYGLGGILYSLLSRWGVPDPDSGEIPRHPNPGKSQNEILDRLLSPEPPHLALAALPGNDAEARVLLLTVELCLARLAKDPNDRPASAAEVAETLEGYHDELPCADDKAAPKLDLWYAPTLAAAADKLGAELAQWEDGSHLDMLKARQQERAARYELGMRRRAVNAAAADLDRLAPDLFRRATQRARGDTRPLDQLLRESPAPARDLWHAYIDESQHLESQRTELESQAGEMTRRQAGEIARLTQELARARQRIEAEQSPCLEAEVHAFLDEVGSPDQFPDGAFADRHEAWAGRLHGWNPEQVRDAAVACHRRRVEGRRRTRQAAGDVANLSARLAGVRTGELRRSIWGLVGWAALLASPVGLALAGVLRRLAGWRGGALAGAGLCGWLLAALLLIVWSGWGRRLARFGALPLQRSPAPPADARAGAIRTG